MATWSIPITTELKAAALELHNAWVATEWQRFAELQLTRFTLKCTDQGAAEQVFTACDAYGRSTGVANTVTRVQDSSLVVGPAAFVLSYELDALADDALATPKTQLLADSQLIALARAFVNAVNHPGVVSAYLNRIDDSYSPEVVEAQYRFERLFLAKVKFLKLCVETVKEYVPHLVTITADCAVAVDGVEMTGNRAVRALLALARLEEETPFTPARFIEVYSGTKPGDAVKEFGNVMDALKRECSSVRTVLASGLRRVEGLVFAAKPPNVVLDQFLKKAGAK